MKTSHPSLLGDDARHSRYIQTAQRRGYRFIASESSKSVSHSPSRPGVVVGRDGALARLHAAWAAAQAGQRQLVFVSGDAGAGKSTLIARFAATSGARVAFGQCIEHYGRGEPYMPVLEALNLLCRAVGGEAVVRALREVAPTWLLQLPWFVSEGDRRHLRREAAGATQDRMLREFGELVDRMPIGWPVLLVLEDLHWSDQATVQLLGYLAHRRAPAAFMVLGTLRPTELVLEEHPLERLRQQLRERRLCAEIDLESLRRPDQHQRMLGVASVRHREPGSSRAPARLIHGRCIVPRGSRPGGPARAVRGERQQPSRDRQVLHEHRQLHRIGESMVEHGAGNEGERGQHRRCEPCAIAEQEGESGPQFQDDDRRQE